MPTRVRFAKRQSGGNALIFTLAMTGFIGAAIFYFGLSYLRTMGQFNQQTTAIEAAALAASNAISKIVIQDPYWGAISMSDYPPTHKGVIAGDNYFCL